MNSSSNAVSTPDRSAWCTPSLRRVHCLASRGVRVRVGCSGRATGHSSRAPATGAQGGPWRSRCFRAGRRIRLRDALSPPLRRATNEPNSGVAELQTIRVRSWWCQSSQGRRRRGARRVVRRTLTARMAAADDHGVGRPSQGRPGSIAVSAFVSRDSVPSAATASSPAGLRCMKLHASFAWFRWNARGEFLSRCRYFEGSRDLWPKH